MSIKKTLVWASVGGVDHGPFYFDVDIGDLEYGYDEISGSWYGLSEFSSILSNILNGYRLYRNFDWYNPEDGSDGYYVLNEGGVMEPKDDPFLREGFNISWSDLGDDDYDFSRTDLRVFYSKFIGDYDDDKYTGSFGEFFPEDWITVDAYTNSEFDMIYELRNGSNGEVIKPKFTND
ncbi:hypothetical protein Sf12_gp36 [Shigella phage Sf12]|uniref:Uncharacterized protein n=1 Tax=Shigella phage Sf12 TaxID=2024315 RepID=A0A291AXL6_9CAUD|nr:hypothetical protein HOR99_gp35 [Shigella phage Sf12]ATE85762.1 hypothetical protein Sf12_gp36 [Shigella phage Sf12]